MFNFTNILINLTILAVIYFLDHYLPKWFRAIFSITFLILMIYLMFLHSNGQFADTLWALIVDKVLLNGI